MNTNGIVGISKEKANNAITPTVIENAVIALTVGSDNKFCILPNIPPSSVETLYDTLPGNINPPI